MALEFFLVRFGIDSKTLRDERKVSIENYED